MKVSLNTIKQFIDFELPPVDELVARINQQLGGVEEVIHLGERYEHARIVRVAECARHPNADKLSVCKIDVGGELVQVVCGAPNVHANMWTVWLPPESIVPSTAGDKEPLKLKSREIRGIVSNGMLAAGDELAINSDHDGIVEIDLDEWRPYNVELKAGALFAEVFGLNDTIIDIENKMFTHRPDLFGQLGVAREIAGILGHQFVSPEWYTKKPEFENREGLALEVFNDANKKVPRLVVATMQKVEVKQSPLWLQCALIAMGSKSINNIVDVTNYIMLLTAQPTHAYDYDKLRGHKLGARMAKKSEKISLLNGKTYELDEDDIVIVDGEGPIGLAGIMGGGNSEVSSDTKNIVLEVANFDMYTLRKSSMRHGIFTDALRRFNKGQSPLQNDRVMNLLMSSIMDVSSAEQASRVFDVGNFNDCLSSDAVHTADSLDVTTDFINQRLGINLSADEQIKLLKNVELKIETDVNGLKIYSAFWRTDIEDPEDVVEEIGRLYGFEKLPRELPGRSAKPAPKNHMIELKQNLRNAMQKAGANEVLTYSFVHERIIKKAKQDVNQAFQLSNALSPDLQYYRLSILPSLLDKVHMNIKQGHDEFVLYEIGKVHNKQQYADDDELPKEMAMVDAIYASKTEQNGAAYYYMKRLVEQLTNDLGLNVVFKKITQPISTPQVAPFDQERSALIETESGEFVGIVGELNQYVQQGFKLPPYVAAFSLDSTALLDAVSTKTTHYQPLSRYPSVTQDVSIVTIKSLPYETIYNTIQKALMEKKGTIHVTVVPVTIYQSEGSNQKTTTLRIRAVDHNRTLTDDEVGELVDYVLTASQSL